MSIRHCPSTFRVHGPTVLLLLAALVGCDDPTYQGYEPRETTALRFQGVVSSGNSGEPIENARVEIVGGGVWVADTTDADGRYVVEAHFGSRHLCEGVELTGQANGYRTTTVRHPQYRCVEDWQTWDFTLEHWWGWVADR